MPIKIQDDLPAKSVLEDEHIFVMTETSHFGAAEKFANGTCDSESDADED